MPSDEFIKKLTGLVSEQMKRTPEDLYEDTYNTMLPISRDAVRDHAEKHYRDLYDTWAKENDVDKKIALLNGDLAEVDARIENMVASAVEDNTDYIEQQAHKWAKAIAEKQTENPWTSWGSVYLDGGLYAMNLGDRE